MHYSLRLLGLLAAAALLGFGWRVHGVAGDADEGTYGPAYRTCMDASNGVTSTMLNCISDELLVQDTRLNQAYRVNISRLEGERQQALRQSQRRWLAARDPGCAAEGEEAGEGSLGRVVAADCVLKKTAKRALYLEEMLND